MNQALAYLDVVIACVAVLVMATSIVLTLTQIALAALNKRKKILTASLAKLLESIGLTPANAGAIATAIVDHPKVKEQGGSVVKREQLVGMLLEEAVTNPALGIALGLGGANPAALHDTLRARVIELEAASPALADHVRRTQAIVENAFAPTGQVIMAGIVEIMSGFDRVCEQMTHAMRTHAKLWTVVFSVMVAIALPLDAIGIAKQLASNPAAVQQLVETAKSLKEAGAPPAQEDLANLRKQLKTQTAQITNPALGIQPGKALALAYWDLGHIFGILTSIALMSLGAPFWFDMLKNLLALRPSLASKETGERAERATTKSI